MTPTPQQIEELAREAGFPDAILEFAPSAIERLIILALERFGQAQAVQQEPAVVIKWQAGGLVAHIVGDVKAGDLLYTIRFIQGK